MAVIWVGASSANRRVPAARSPSASSPDDHDFVPARGAEWHDAGRVGIGSMISRSRASVVGPFVGFGGADEDAALDRSPICGRVSVAAEASDLSMLSPTWIREPRAGVGTRPGG